MTKITDLGLPPIKSAKLPAVYVDAKKALDKCERVDECKSWADRALAIASYARQAADESLLKTATRIRARAIRRCGELLRQIEPKHTGRPAKNVVGTDPNSRKAAATAAGLSERQRKDALRVASIPKAKFERAVESDDPPTIAELSKEGKQAAAARAYRTSPKPPGFQAATELLGLLEEILDFFEKEDLAKVAAALEPDERANVRRRARNVIRWFEKLERKVS